MEEVTVIQNVWNSTGQNSFLQEIICQTKNIIEYWGKFIENVCGEHFHMGAKLLFTEKEFQRIPTKWNSWNEVPLEVDENKMSR